MRRLGTMVVGARCKQPSDAACRLRNGHLSIGSAAIVIWWRQ
jgi:hypothetical protein